MTRLRDMGVEPYLLASTLRAVMAQRLVRQLCCLCKAPRPATDPEKAALGFSIDLPLAVHEAEGCIACGHTGYKGRLGIYELLIVDARVRHLLAAGAGEDDIDAAAFSVADRLLDNARRYVAAGETSAAEVMRACRREARHGSV